MYFQPFHERFPEISERETRSITTFRNTGVPKDDYGLVESYCNEPDCDCRRVFFNVLAHRQNKIVAVITYGWEDEDFYIDWLGENRPDAIRAMKGPALNVGSRQAEYALALLDLIESRVLTDKSYVERLKRHYRMFKRDVAREHEAEQPRSVPKLAKRNDPCPCGSGKKYKYCCGRRR